jgi:hypothetical protein
MERNKELQAESPVIELDLISKFLNFIRAKFDKMPLWVRVITFLIIVLLIVFLVLYLAYSSLTPKFVYGRFMQKDAHGGRVPIPEIVIEMSEQGHNLKFVSNEDGCWVAPLMNRLPHDVQIEVLHPDYQSLFSLTFKAQEVFLKQGKTFNIEIAKDSPYVKLAALDPRSSGLSERVLAAVLRPNLLQPPSAFAGELKLPEPIQTNDSCALSIQEKDSIKVKVVRTVSKYLSSPVQSVEDTLPLSAPTVYYVEKVQIVKALETEFKLNIPPEHWKYLNTVGELVAYIQKRIILQGYLEKEMKVKDIPKSWYSIQKLFPVERAPKMVSH